MYSYKSYAKSIILAIIFSIAISEYIVNSIISLL